LNPKKLKIAFYVGELPATTFINRLAEGLARQGMVITMFGLMKKSIKPIVNIRFSGARDGKNEGRRSKYFRYLKYAMLLWLANQSDKKKIDCWLVKTGNTHWGRKALIYPIVYFKPDILHVQWAKGIDQFAWAQDVNIKLVLSLRGAHINYSPITMPGLAESYRKVFPVVDGFHAVSKAIAIEASKYGAPLEKCRVVYSGFDLRAFNDGSATNDFLTLRNRTVKVVSVGRSHWKKGYHHALDAMAMLKQSGFDFSYTIVGAADVEELLFQQNQLGLTECVKLLGGVPFAEVKQLIKGADILLLPSVEEGIANVVLEAMLLGTLVVSTNCGGMEEVVEHEQTGFIVPVRNPAAIAHTLERIKIAEPMLLNVIVKNARKKVEAQHSEEKMVEGMMQLYQSIN